ncbi:3-hydroxyisobutyryl-CoA hydrolase, mitochondrial, partial [Cyphomyrmex costatus]
KIIHQKVGDNGVIILNRPKVLNAINLSMAQKIYSFLKQWEPSKKLVIMEGMGEKAFCASGDVKSLALVLLNEPKDQLYPIEQLFRENCILNHLIGTYKKPYVAIINGIIMGTGVGLAIFGKYRIATKFKMFPTSLKITKKTIDEGKGKSLADCLKIEFRLTCTALTRDGDFYEGVRALLIDKDRKPVWKPTFLIDVTNEYLNKQFAVLPVEKELQFFVSANYRN